MADRGTSWIKTLAAGSEGSPRLFCFPYAGGGTATFRNWPSLIDLDVRISAIRLPGRETRIKEPPFTSLHPLVQEAAEALAPELGRSPYVFFGHSMGGLIAFALCREFRRRGVRLPHVLIVSGSLAPHLPPPRPPIADLPEPEFIEELRRLAGTPPELLEHAELMELMLPMLRADCAVSETHRLQPEAPLPCPIVAFGGADDADITVDDVKAWGIHTSSAFTYKVFAGGHFFLHTHENDVVREVERYLAHLPATHRGG